MATDIHTALAGSPTRIHTVIAGLGGRAITKASLHRLFDDATADRLDGLNFLDLDRELVGRELRRMGDSRRSGPSAENILRDVGVVASTPTGTGMVSRREEQS